VGWCILGHKETIEALNDGSKTLDDVSEVVALNDFANSNPDVPLAGNLRSDLNRLASVMQDVSPKKKRVHTRSKAKKKKPTTSPTIAKVSEVSEDETK